MKTKSAWLLPLGVAITCVPCLLIPVGLALIAGGAFGGVLGFLGIPWVLALIIAVPTSGVLIALWLRRRTRANCEVPFATRASPDAARRRGS